MEIYYLIDRVIPVRSKRTKALDLSVHPRYKVQHRGRVETHRKSSGKVLALSQSPDWRRKNTG